MRSVTIDVPATLSNLGPGFDVLGLAIGVSNQFTFTEVSHDDGGRLDEHAALVAARAMADALGYALPGLAVTQVERVPRSRGLGSSATARVAGALAVAALASRPGDALPVARVAAVVAALEGHPDNALPALIGGLVVCGPGASFARYEPLAGLSIALCIPSLEVSTDAARRALPDAYSRAIVVRQGARLAALVGGLVAGPWARIADGLADEVHEPYRAPLIGPVDAVRAAATNAGALGAFISGSGSTLAAFVGPDGNADRVADAMVAAFAAAGGGPADALVVVPELCGAVSRVTVRA